VRPVRWHGGCGPVAGFGEQHRAGHGVDQVQADLAVELQLHPGRHVAGRALVAGKAALCIEAGAATEQPQAGTPIVLTTVGGQGGERPLRIKHLPVGIPGARFAAEILPQRQTQPGLDLPLPGRRLRGGTQPRQAVASVGFPVPEGQQLQQFPLLRAGQLFSLPRRFVPPDEPP
jgi:hypothetical protein